MQILLLSEFKSETRGYMLLIKRDLFGDLSLVRYWYGLYNKRGGFKHDLFETFEEAKKKFNILAAKRQKRGYVLVLHNKE